MRISAKGRYALAAMTCMAQQYSGGEYITVASISQRLGISKIYLEQVFSLLKRGKIVGSVKGAQGGYHLTRSPEQITALDILAAVETSLFETTEESVGEKSIAIERTMNHCVFETLDRAVHDVLSSVTLADFIVEAQKQQDNQAMMFYI